MSSGWLDASELRIGLGCMRLANDESGIETIAAAVAAGVTVFDTARAYGDNERLVARALAGSQRARIVTKGGMTRAGDAWVPDGRAKSIRADCEASLAALDGLPIDLYLIHAPDPRTPWRTSVRALARLVDESLVRRIGVSNVNRTQLDEALELAPVAAVEVALSVYDERAIRGGLVERCDDTGIALIAHSPLGGPRRVGRLGRDETLARVAAGLRASPAEVALAWLLDVSPAIVPIPGARRPETARSAARAATIALDDDARAALAPRRPQPRAVREGEVVLVMGIPGAGKSRLSQEYLARGYVRLNRDERGGSLAEVAHELDERLASGGSRLVLDNTYLTRAARSYVVDAARRHGVPVRCVWLDTPLAQAQVNLVERVLDRLGSLPTPEELQALSRREQGLLAPTSQMRTLRELEPPSADEGFAAVDHVPFSRSPPPDRTRAGVFVAAAALRGGDWKRALAEPDREAPHLLFDWIPDGSPDALAPLAAELAAEVAAPVETAVCPHGAGPPRCWCRPPLPGLPLAFARRHGIDPARSVLVGSAPAGRTLATALGARYVDVAR
jgi:aryl-alcohol dehydrogenase-like predicted oxidoreductase